MKKFIFVLVLFCFGCTPVQAFKVANALQTAAKVTDFVCNAGQLYDLIEAPAPNPKTCEKTAENLSRKEYQILVEAIDCVEKNDTRESQVDCLLFQTDWRYLARKFQF